MLSHFYEIIIYLTSDSFTCWMERKRNMERFVAPMATWEIVGGDLPPVRVRARTFDEALAKARLRDPGYCAGWVVEEG